MPSRFLSVACCSIVLAAGTTFYCRFGPPTLFASAGTHADTRDGMWDSAQVASLDEQLARRAPFREFADRLYRDLARKQISLRDATEQLFYYSLSCYPEYLQNVWIAEPGSNMKMKVARNFVRGFHMAVAPAEWGEPASAIAARLERELRELPYEKSERGIKIAH
jgi:hypothetical protein